MGDPSEGFACRHVAQKGCGFDDVLVQASQLLPPSIQGLQYETNRVVSDTIESVFHTFGSDMIDAVMKDILVIVN